MLAKRTLEERRDAIKHVYKESIFQPFDQIRECPIPFEGFIHPANQYQKTDILARLPQMPEPEQPSCGWKWFGHKYDVDSLGIGLDAWDGEA